MKTRILILSAIVIMSTQVFIHGNTLNEDNRAGEEITMKRYSMTGEEQQEDEQKTKRLIKSDPIKYSGYIKNVIRDKYTNKREFIVVETIPSESFPDQLLFKIKEDTIVFDRNFEDEQNVLGEGKVTDIKEGMTATIFFEDNYNLKDFKVGFDIYPQIDIDLIVLNLDVKEDSVIVTNINDEFLTTNKSTKINISPDTIMIDRFNNKLGVDDIINKNILVFHNNIMTTSIPNQTTASKIVFLDKTFIFENHCNKSIGNLNLNCLSVKEIEDLTEEEKNSFLTYSVTLNNKTIHLANPIYSIRNHKMLPIREVFEGAGYTVLWLNNNTELELRRNGYDAVTYLPFNDFYGKSKIITHNNVSYVSHTFLTDFMELTVDFN